MAWHGVVRYGIVCKCHTISTILYHYCSHENSGKSMRLRHALYASVHDFLTLVSRGLG